MSHLYNQIRFTTHVRERERESERERDGYLCARVPCSLSPAANIIKTRGLSYSDHGRTVRGFINIFHYLVLTLMVIITGYS